MIKYIIKENNGTGIIADENNNPRYFDDGESAADWAEKNDVDPDAWIITKKNIISPKVPTKSSKAIASNLRDTAKEIQDEYDRSNDIFPVEVITDPTQGIAGDIYDVAS